MIAIIGTLATIGIADYARFGVRAKYGRAKAELFGISTVIQGLRITNDTGLSGITGSGCTYCVGNPVSSWIPLGYTTPPLDPWGTPYVLDENESEFGATDCRMDSLITAGNDRQVAGLVAQGLPNMAPAGDDLLVNVPYYYSHSTCPGSMDYSYGPDYKY